MSDEAPITVTLKLEGAGAPWLVLRSNDPNQAQQQLDAIAAGGLGDAMARAESALQAAYNVNKTLGGVTQQAPTGNPFGAAPAGQPAAWDVPQAPQNTIQQAPPQNFPQHQEPVPSQHGQPQYQQPQQYGQAPQQQYQQPPQQAAPAGVPGAPLVQGIPAKMVSSKPGAAKQWQAWADPRPASTTEYMEKTDDPNHPGLNAGTHKLWMFIR